MAVINPPERKLAKHTSVQCVVYPLQQEIHFRFKNLEKKKKNHTFVGFFGMPYLGIVRLRAPIVCGELLTK